MLSVLNSKMFSLIYNSEEQVKVHLFDIFIWKMTHFIKIGDNCFYHSIQL